MLIKATSQAIKKHAQALLGNEWSEQTQKALIKEAYSGFERTYGHISHDRAAHLERLNDIMKSCGVEGFLENGMDVQYVNQGDTYAMTLLYSDGELFIGDWGSIVEENS